MLFKTFIIFLSYFIIMPKEKLIVVVEVCKVSFFRSIQDILTWFISDKYK